MPLLWSKLFSLSKAATLDYEQAIHLDAEDLAEQGIGKAYERLLPELGKHVAQPAEVQEVIDDDLRSYAVRCNGEEHLIYSSNEPNSERESWGRATYFFFQVVNSQLTTTGVRFYAINGGNDLFGMFLSQEHAQAVRAGLPRKADWPYLPEFGEPWWGQSH